MNIQKIMNPVTLYVESNKTITVWHGGNLDSLTHGAKPKGTANTRYEYGPGLYTTTHYGTAKMYSKGGKKLYKLIIREGIDSSSIIVPINALDTFLSINSYNKQYKSYIPYIKEKYGSEIPLNTLINILTENKILKDIHSLTNFILDQGADYRIVSNAFGWGETMLVLFNMSLIEKHTIVKSSDNIEEFDLNPDFQ